MKYPNPLSDTGVLLEIDNLGPLPIVNVFMTLDFDLGMFLFCLSHKYSLTFFYLKHNVNLISVENNG